MDIFPKKTQKGPKLHENVPNITNYQRNSNQNHNEIPLVCGMQKNQTHKNRKQIGVHQRQRLGEMLQGSHNIQTSHYKINKSWGCTVQNGYRNE